MCATEDHWQAPQIVVLIGPPGSGKSWIGRVLRDSLGWSFRETERELIQHYGSREAFLQDKEAALDRVARELLDRVAASPVPVVFETTGLSDRAFIQRLRREFTTVFVKLFAPRDLCVRRVRDRAPGAHLNEDPDWTASFHDLWSREVEPTCVFDLEFVNDGREVGGFLERLARHGAG